MLAECRILEVLLTMCMVKILQDRFLRFVRSLYFVSIYLCVISLAQALSLQTVY